MPKGNVVSSLVYRERLYFSYALLLAEGMGRAVTVEESFASLGIYTTNASRFPTRRPRWILSLPHERYSIEFQTLARSGRTARN